jgi:hypothetical protein
MQQIADWLAKIGLERYAPTFADNDIDVSVLPHLTDADLEKIGVSLGHRRKMLAAIAELVGAMPPQSAIPEAKPQDTAERRQVTVMFSDLVGSTALSARMVANRRRRDRARPYRAKAPPRASADIPLTEKPR